MSIQHTPSPWVVRNATEVFCGRKRVCHVNAATKDKLNMIEEQFVAEANARLIASAPELLAALKDLFGADMAHCMMGDGKDDQIAAIAKARAAIAKAEQS